jgi:hypothetical protein
MLDFSKRSRRWPLPSIENGALTIVTPPTMERLRLWKQAAIMVQGRPDWLFVKLHCHGMDPRDDEAVRGSLLQAFLRDLNEDSRNRREYQVHFVTAREMTNIILAACEGREDNPGNYRDYRLRLIGSKEKSEPRGDSPASPASDLITAET